MSQNNPEPPVSPSTSSTTILKPYLSLCKELPQIKIDLVKQVQKYKDAVEEHKNSREWSESAEAHLKKEIDSLITTTKLALQKADADEETLMMEAEEELKDLDESLKELEHRGLGRTEVIKYQKVYSFQQAAFEENARPFNEAAKYSIRQRIICFIKQCISVLEDVRNRPDAEELLNAFAAWKDELEKESRAINRGLIDKNPLSRELIEMVDILAAREIQRDDSENAQCSKEVNNRRPKPNGIWQRVLSIFV